MNEQVAVQRAWRYEGIGPNGAVAGRMDAGSEVELDAALAREGITLLKARRTQATSSASGGRMSAPDLVTFTTQLATVLGAGVPIVEGMRDLGTRMRNPASRKVVADRKSVV